MFQLAGWPKLESDGTLLGPLWEDVPACRMAKAGSRLPFESKGFQKKRIRMSLQRTPFAEQKKLTKWHFQVTILNKKSPAFFPIFAWCFTFYRAVIQAWMTDDRRDRPKAFGGRSFLGSSQKSPKIAGHIFGRSLVGRRSILPFLGLDARGKPMMSTGLGAGGRSWSVFGRSSVVFHSNPHFLYF